MLEVGKENPVNSKVCEVASVVILMSEENGFALDGEFIDKVAAVLALEVARVVVFWKSCNDVFKPFKLEVNSPKAEIDALFSSIFLFKRSFSGVVSAWTKLSTIWVIFKPDPFWFNALI